MIKIFYEETEDDVEARPYLVCDYCGEKIGIHDDGRYLWRADRSKANDIYMVHGRCDRAMTAKYGLFEFDHIIWNLGDEPEHRLFDRLIENMKSVK